VRSLALKAPHNYSSETASQRKKKQRKTPHATKHEGFIFKSERYALEAVTDTGFVPNRIKKYSDFKVSKYARNLLKNEEEGTWRVTK